MTLSIKGKGKPNNNKTGRRVGLSHSELKKLLKKDFANTNKIWYTMEEATFICIIHTSQSIIWEVKDNIGEDLPTYRMPKFFDKTSCPFKSYNSSPDA